MVEIEMLHRLNRPTRKAEKTTKRGRGDFLMLPIDNLWEKYLEVAVDRGICGFSS